MNWLPTLGCLVSVCVSASTLALEQKISTMDVGPAGIIITHMEGKIALQDGAAPTTDITLTITNSSEKNFTGTIGFRGGDSQPITLTRGNTATVAVAPDVQYRGQRGHIQKAVVDLTILMNGDLPQNAVESVNVAVSLPEGGSPLMKATPPLIENDGILPSYILFARGQYTSPLTMLYTMAPVNVRIHKTLTPNPVKEGPVTVSLTLTNVGNAMAKGLLIKDSLDPRDFSGQGEGFTLYQGEANDQRLLWEHTLASLKAGEKTTVRYEVIANGAVHDVALDAASVVVDNELAGISNKVWLYK